MLTRLVIIGAGGLGREVVETVRAMRSAGGAIECVGCLVEPAFSPADNIGGLPVFDDLSELLADPSLGFVTAIGDPRVRARFARRLAGRAVSVVHPSARIGSTVEIGAGSIVLPMAVMTAAVRVGAHVLLNPHVSISHDCVIGDFATFGPAVALAGGVHVEEGAELGIGACVTPRQRVGRWSMVGAGAVVISQVPEGSVVAGIPARVIRRPGVRDAPCDPGTARK